jgi:hypothetical protein
VTLPLSAGSRHQHLALYDPAAIPPELPLDPDLDAQEPAAPPISALRQLAGDGGALIVRIPSEDCEASFEVLVDEEPDALLRRRGRLIVSGSRLRIPSGELRADGMEFMCRPGQVRRDIEPDSLPVSPGVYALEVLELLSWKLAHASEEVRRDATRLERLAHRLTLLYTWLGVLMLPANILVAPVVALYAHARYGWTGLGLAVAGVALLDLVVFGGFWLLEAAQRRYPALSRVHALREGLERAHPDLVVLLRSSSSEDARASPAFAEIELGP